MSAGRPRAAASVAVGRQPSALKPPADAFSAIRCSSRPPKGVVPTARASGAGDSRSAEVLAAGARAWSRRPRPFDPRHVDAALRHRRAGRRVSRVILALRCWTMLRGVARG